MHAKALVLFPLLVLAATSVTGPVQDAAADAQERPAIATEEVDYTHGDAKLCGYLARPAMTKGRLPAVLLVHAWRGQDDFVRERARWLAGKGYVALALDMYGKGVLAKDSAEAGKLAGRFYGDRRLYRDRARAGLAVLLEQEDVDPRRVAAIGFCFGGTAVLELARDGAELAGVVSFHGGLETSMPAEEGKVKARVLVCHGGEDPLVPPDHVQAFWKEMREAGADHQILILSGAVHAFTDPGARSKAAAYDPTAAARAFGAMDRFFAEVLAGS